MRKPLLWAAAMSTAAMMPSAASACDLDGMPGFGGMHRFNPFAKAMPLNRAPDRPMPSASSSEGDRSDRARSEDRAREERNSDRQRERERPRRQWEGDYGNGSISADDKATFT